MEKLIQFRWVQRFDLNCRDVLFGGKLLSSVDEDCTMVCQINAKAHSVFTTAGYDRVNFLKPAFIGDKLKFVYEIINVGRSSITVLVKVYVMTGDAEFTDIIFTALATLVTIKDGKPCDAESCLLDKIDDLRNTERWKKAEKLISVLKSHRKEQID